MEGEEVEGRGEEVGRVEAGGLPFTHRQEKEGKKTHGNVLPVPPIAASDVMSYPVYTWSRGWTSSSV